MDSRDIFLSHRSINKDFVTKLASDIEQQEYKDHKLMTWVDEAEIRPGQSIPGIIEKGLESSRYFGILMTPEYFTSESGWTDAEWHAALFQDPDNRKGRIIPLLVDDCPYIPFLLNHLNAIDFRGKKYKRGLEKLLAVLREEPLPRPITYRGQLINSTGKIDRKTLVAERAIPDADPDVITERLFCNLLEIQSLPRYIYTASITNKYKVRKKSSIEDPTKQEIKTQILAYQSKNNYERLYSPVFRFTEGKIVTFHDLSSPDNPFGDVYDEKTIQAIPTIRYMMDKNRRLVVTSLLNMSLSRHMTKRGLIVDSKNDGRYFFPPKDGGIHKIVWKPNKIKATRTVVKPYEYNGVTKFWRHLGAYMQVVFIGDQFYLKIIPTWVITEDGENLMLGSRVTSIVNRWTGAERNIHLLYHIRFWTYILQGGRFVPTIWIKAGDQKIEVSSVPAYAQLPYGIEDDHINLMAELDKEASTIAEIEEDLGDAAIIYEENNSSNGGTDSEEEIL